MMLAFQANANTWCYQQSANDSSINSSTGEVNGDCAIYTGSYSFASTGSAKWNSNNFSSIDGNWVTSGTGTMPSNNNNLFLVSVFVIPIGATNNSVWSVKVIHNNVGSGINFTNWSLPQSCWDYSLNFSNLSLRYHAKTLGGGDVFPSLECLDGQGWKSLTPSSSYWTISGGSPRLYDEAMWWDIQTANPVSPITGFSVNRAANIALMDMSIAIIMLVLVIGFFILVYGYTEKIPVSEIVSSIPRIIVLTVVAFLLITMIGLFIQAVVSSG